MSNFLVDISDCAIKISFYKITEFLKTGFNYPFISDVIKSEGATPYDVAPSISADRAKKDRLFDTSFLQLKLIAQGDGEDTVVRDL